ncbi:MAG: hypothetical protein M1830_009013 [Pleopsidium flavum]|nr:MAG: hypothetical protein M1830_009013 [Pleopsidium flavum]
MDSRVPVAIIGMSCRFAGDVSDPEKLWQLCADGRSAWSEIPSSRFNLDGVYHPNFEKPNTTNVRGGHFLTEDIALFDASFFNLSSETAASMDPQFRLQLESTYEALESAGITLQEVAGSNTSVFAGAFFRDYHDSHLRDPETLPRFLLMGVGSAMASNRISHFYDLRGASMSVDTGCSTTLTALHQACQSLRTGESDINVILNVSQIDTIPVATPNEYLRLLSPAGKSYAFDSRASGYGRGEGSATVILKRLDDALRDGDPIRAVIRGSGLNQDGKTETITTPSQEAQEELIRACYRKAGLDPSHTAYFEAHGTGTPTGDPIEARAVASVFQDKRLSEQPLRMGSIKTNIGHTETASGLASIIKVALALEKGQIPPSINFEKPNEKLHLEEWNLKVPTQLESWPDSTGVRRASVNNFGYGGANAHVIIEDYKSFTSSGLSAQNGISNGVTHGVTNGVTNGVNGHHAKLQSRVIILSAKDEHAAQAMASNLKDYLLTTKVEDEEKFLDSLAYTLGQRRSIFPWIAAQPVQSVSDLIKAIESGRMKPTRTNGPPRLGFVFTGQGAQWYAMGRELIEAYPEFKAYLLEAEGYLKELGATWSLIDELMRDAETSRVNELTISMPLCVALQVSLVRLLRSWEITPTAVTSHSSGEIAAAYAAGALSLQSAMAIVFARGELAADVGRYITSKGGMIAVGLRTEEVDKYISRVSSGKVMVACMNSPTSITVSGDVPAVEELETMLKEDNVFARRLKVDAAYHSHHMQPIADPYLAWLQKLVKAEERLADVIYSSPTTGTRMTSVEEIGSPKHWVRSLTHPVQFVEAFRNMCFGDSSASAPDVDVVIEVGPHAALSGPIQEMLTLPEFKGCKISYLTCLVRKSSALDTMHALSCDLIRKGYPVNMNSINFPHGRHGVRVLHDLPHYPWNHQTRHWSEPRFNKAHRQRLEAPHDLLGSLVLGTNMLAPSWRHFIRPSDLPWVRDHTVQSNIVYPGAGFICMAIEGAFQASQAGGKHILAYQLRDVDILQALIIPDTAEGIEVQLTLRPCSDKAIYAKGWKEFQVYSVSGENKWTEHCKGLILVDFASAGDDQARWNTSASPTSKHVRSRKATNYRIRIDPQDIYGGMRSVGIYHGPIFQNLKSIRAQNKQSVSIFAVADTASAMPSHYQHKHVLNPTTLDSVFQAAYTALPGAGSKMSSPQVPRSIKKLWVAHNITSDAGHCFRAYSDVSRADLQSFDAGVVVINDDDDDNTKSEPVLMIDGFVCQTIGNAITQQTDPHENEKFSTVRWAPDISFIKPAFLKQQLGYTINSTEADTIVDLRRVCFYFINDAFAALTAADVQQLEWHHKKFYIWMKFQAELASLNKLAPGSSEWIHASAEEKTALIEKANAASVNGEMVCCLGPHITSMLRREVTPLELMLKDKLLYRYYVEGLKWDRSSRQMGELVKHFAHKNPRAKILEIGGGTGGTTTYVLNALGTDDSEFGPLATSYDFTDISSGFFEAAQEKFKAWKNLVRYKKLDIEQNLVKQGFESGTYDLIVACQVLHATKSMENTMTNVRKLLKPGGKLFIMETTQDQLDLQFVFGLLPGWWLSEEEERKFSPSLSINMWDGVLHKTRFSGVETEVHDCESEELYSFSVITSTATSSAPTFDSDVVFVTGTPAPPDSWLEELKISITGVMGAVPAIEPLESVVGDGKLCVFLGEIDHPILNSPDSAQFEAIKALCTKSKGLLWVTRGGAVDCESPDASLNVGFLRSLRAEYSGKRLTALDLDPKQEPWSNQSVATVTEVFGRMFDYSTDDALKDFEFADRDGVIHIPRYYKDVHRNKAIFLDSASQAVPKLEPFHQLHRPLRLFIGTPGLLDTLAFNDDLDAAEDLHPDSLEVDPKAFGLNFRDVMVAMGQVSGGAMGFECSGVVTRVGPGAASQGFKAGDRVAMLLRGHYANLVRLHWTSAVHIPDDMSFEVAATLPMSYTTAYVSLYDTARLQKGETVLIHAATGGFGQAAIVLAKHVGAEIFVTVGTESKRDFVIKKYGIQPDHIFSSRDTSFAAGVLAMTQGKGVDIVLNTLAGALLQESFNCIAPFGRFIEIGKRDLELNSSLEMGAFTRAVSFSSIDLLALGIHKGHEINRVLKDIIRLFKEKVINPIETVTVHPLSDIEKTFRLMQAGKHMGKIVISVKPDDLVPVLPQTPSAKLRPDSSYLIVGGLGGIGRSVCHWMADHGARNLIVLSRSANAQEKAGPFLAEMEKVGCRVKAIGCDISDESELAKALGACAQEMPPIRGVIQGAMVLQDSILEQMTLEDYYVAIRPKVQGSWNLHLQLSSHELDFFVMLSSLAGIVGYASQCNYSAGGTFQDALARYRTARGLPGVAIDLGVVKSVGYVAENDGTADRLKKSGHMVLSEDDVLGAVESAITSPPSTQIMFGLNSGPGRHWEESPMARDLRFSSLRYRQSAQYTASVSKAGSTDLGSKIAAASSFDEAVEVIVKGITKKLMDIFMVAEEEVTPSKALSDYGVDSLVAVELRNMLALRAGSEISIFDIMQSRSITALSAMVASKSSHIDPCLMVA